jgi:peptidoglycan/xylan/chitin deacetylase (PgdA/CDA1 family)
MSRVRAIPILMYHDIADSIRGVPASHRPYVLTTDRFQDQMKALSELSVCGAPLADHLEGGCPIARSVRCCIITFDDGHESNYSHALERLQGSGLRATFFVTVGWIGKASYLSWEQTKALASAGMEIGSHTMTHRPPAALTPTELLAELRDSKRLLEDRLGQPIASASSPTGFFNPRMSSAAQEAGYEALCFGRIAMWCPSDSSFAVPRIPVKASTSTQDVRRAATGDERFIAVQRRRQRARDGLKSILGVNGYLRLRRWYLRMRGNQP